MLLQRVENLIRNNGLFHSEDRVIAAISGGADSVTLLHLLNKISLPIKIIAVYVDHGLRPDETGNEIALIKNFCTHLHLDFETVQVDTYAKKHEMKTSLEEAARIVRYQALEEMRIRYNATAIAVAHTADDQAEELLIRLIRGTGRKGLSGMQLQRDHIIRPLLKEKKATLLSYLKEKNIPFCLDSSNQERSFLRNRIRLDLLPYLEENFNTSIRQNLLQTTDILTQEEELLEELTQEKFKKVVQVDGCRGIPPGHTPKIIAVNIPFFQACHQALQRRILEKICWLMATKPGFRQIQQLRHVIQDGKDGAEIHLKEGLRIEKAGSYALFSHPHGRKSLRGRLSAKKVTIYKEIPQPGVYTIENTDMTLSVNVREKMPGDNIEDGLQLDAKGIRFPLLLRTALPGEKFSPLGMGGSKKITRFLSDKKIPLSRRHLFPLLISAEKILAIAGLRIDNRFRLQSATKRILIVDWKETDSKADS